MKCRCVVWIVVLAANASWLAGCAAKPDPATDQHAYWQQLGAALKDSAQPREQALAAYLLGLGLTSAPEGTRANSRKPAADPATYFTIRNLLAEVHGSHDAIALSIATQAAVEQNNQDLTNVMAGRWQLVEPDNLAPRLFSDTPIDAVLLEARKATRYETHAYGQIRFMTSVFKRWHASREEAGSGYSKLPESDEARAAVNAFGIWAAYGIPAFQKLTRACRDKALLSTSTRGEDCLHVARVMADNSDDLFSMGVGIAMLQRAAITPEDIALAATLRRNKEWQQHQYYEVLTQGMNEQEQVTDMVRLLKTRGVDNEIQLMQAGLREKGVALTAPDDWQPPG